MKYPLIITSKKQTKVSLCQNEKNGVQSHKVIFQKSQKLLTYRDGHMPQTKAGKAVTNPTIDIEWIEYWMFWKRSLLWSSLCEQFLWFFKMTCFDFTAIFSFFTQATLVFYVLHNENYTLLKPKRHSLRYHGFMVPA